MTGWSDGYVDDYNHSEYLSCAENGWVGYIAEFSLYNAHSGPVSITNPTYSVPLNVDNDT